MRALLDINVLIALLDADHASHARATAWFADQASRGWASCPLTQNGCLRIMTNPAYPNPVPIAAVVERLVEATSTSHHEFWADDVSLLNPRVARGDRIHGARQVTDVYLLALAVEHGGRFVTFDQSIALDAARGATADHILVL